MQRPDRGSIEAYQAPALEHAINDRLPQILVMQDAAQAFRPLSVVKIIELCRRCRSLTT